jgi:hypothetical protein
MNEIEQSPPSDTVARLEGRRLAAGALLLVGIGFWQHYTEYVEAEQRGEFVTNVQSNSTMATTEPAMVKTFAHTNIHSHMSDISWRDCRYRRQ